ncbi:MAG: hypothetical protein OK455_10375, partial [Thaumarchaeota archaeon]|nr:hypothetical protein [Nitrososphaerota archaeon]
KKSVSPVVSFAVIQLLAKELTCSSERLLLPFDNHSSLGRSDEYFEENGVRIRIRDEQRSKAN